MISKAFVGHWTRVATLFLLLCSFSAYSQEKGNTFFHDMQYETGVNIGVYSGEIAPGIFFQMHKPLLKHKRGEFLLGVFNNLSPTNFAVRDLNKASDNFHHSGYQANLQLLHPSVGYRAYFLKRRLNLALTASGGYHMYTTKSGIKSDVYNFDVTIRNTEHYITGGIQFSLGYKIGAGTYANLYLYNPIGNQELINPVFAGLGIAWHLTGRNK